MRFRDLLVWELGRRRSHNPRYSLRAFARSLHMHHSALSRLLRSEAPLATRSIRQLGAALALPVVDIERYCQYETERALLAAVQTPNFTPDSRQLASKLCVPLDAINIALQSALRQRVLNLPSPSTWRVNTEPSS